MNTHTLCRIASPGSGGSLSYRFLKSFSVSLSPNQLSLWRIQNTVVIIPIFGNRGNSITYFMCLPLIYLCDKDIFRKIRYRYGHARKLARLQDLQILCMHIVVHIIHFISRAPKLDTPALRLQSNNNNHAPLNK